jgi:prophage regulatory protein
MKDVFLRLPQILGDAKANPPIPALIPICKTAWYAGIKNGIYPKGIKLSPRVCVWRESEIQALIQNFNKGKV